MARSNGRSDGHAVRRTSGFLSPALTATALAAVMLHLLASLAAHLASADAASAVTVLLGMAAVLVTLLPFTLLCARRAGEALRRGA
ncbi:uncharacterized membrane protein YhaH (DUF805 family) [Azospirillum canadense]|nr:uncharacterized membrane protein YhaH (DUF805 family) [Azospirillum canadense]